MEKEPRSGDYATLFKGGFSVSSICRVPVSSCDLARSRHNFQFLEGCC